MQGDVANERLKGLEQVAGKGILLSLVLTPHDDKNCNKTLQYWLQKSFLRESRDQSGGWGGEGRIDEVWNLEQSCWFSQLAKRSTRNSSQRYLQAANNLRCCS